MKRCIQSVLAVVVLLALGACSSSGPKYTQAQLNALETREVDADLDETFNAASNALFDSGYTISMSDREGGLLTGTRNIDRSKERYWWSRRIEDTSFTISIMIREIGDDRCSTRVKTAVNGSPKVDERAIDEFWTLMRRQVLMKKPFVANAAAGTGT